MKINKQTSINEWRTAKLGELMPSRAGTIDPSKYLTEIFDLYSIPAFDAADPDVLVGEQIGSTKQFVEAGDVLLSKIVPHIRRAWVVGESRGRRTIASNEWIVFRDIRIEPRFMRHLFLEDSFHRAFMSTVSGVGGSLLRARPSHVANIEVRLPPLPEQRRIADILDRAEALRAKRRAALAQLDSLTQSIFLEMFGDPNSKGWPTTSVEGIASQRSGSIRTGPFGSQLLHSEFTDAGIAVLGIDNAVSNEFRWSERRFISESKYQQLTRYTVYPGDVLITIMGTCGSCAVVPDDVPLAINTKHLCCITLDSNQCLPKFLHAYFLQHPIAKRYLHQTAKGAIMSGLNMGIIQKMPVALPPLPLQREYVQKIDAVEKLRRENQLSLAELEGLFASLQHRAFRGEL